MISLVPQNSFLHGVISVFGYFYDIISQIALTLSIPIKDLTTASISYTNPFTNVTSTAGLGSWFSAIENWQPADPTYNFLGKFISLVTQGVNSFIAFIFGVDSSLPIGVALLLILVPIVISIALIKIFTS